MTKKHSDSSLSYRFARRLLFQLEPETAHETAVSAAKLLQKTNLPLHLVESLFRFDSRRLHTHAFGLEFPSPLGLAAGFDKNGEVVDFLAATGFGFVEIGAVTAKASHGNEKPRLFRLEEDRALINRMGLNNDGPEEICRNLGAQHLRVPLGINIAKTNDRSIFGDAATQDFVDCFAAISPAASFVVLNLSCPNTEDGRTFEERAALDRLLKSVMHKRDELLLDVPVLLKFSTDLDLEQLEILLTTGEENGADGYVLGNTSVSREGLRTPQAWISAIGAGGLSGRPLFERALRQVQFASRQLQGKKPIIACGGLQNGEGMYRFLKAGATLVELYTAFVYQGPGVCKRILKDLLRLMDRDGVKQVGDIIGVESRSE